MHPTPSLEEPFTTYIKRCEQLIKEKGNDDFIESNSPFEYLPENNPTGIGALLIHGLFDCPFTMRELAKKMSEKGITCRAVLLPGHGTQSDALVTATQEEWINTVKGGIDSFGKTIKKIVLIGYSTGAALAIREAYEDTRVQALVLLAPAIRMNETIDVFVGLQHVTQTFNKNQKWLVKQKENDYCKYQSIALNAVLQLSRLTKDIAAMGKKKKLAQPIFMALSREDETISSHMAIDFFHRYKNENSRLILYSAHPKTTYGDKRIITRSAVFPELNIKHLSHSSLLFSPENSHYGQHGDYPLASRIDKKKTIYGAYNAVEKKSFDLLHQMKLVNFKRRVLTYNPDFDFLAEEVVGFIHRTCA